MKPSFELLAVMFILILIAFYSDHKGHIRIFSSSIGAMVTVICFDYFDKTIWASFMWGAITTLVVRILTYKELL